MKTNQMAQKLKTILKDLNLVHKTEDISLNDDLFAIGALDSLILVQYILAIEDELKVSIPNNKINYENFKTFQSQISFLETIEPIKRSS